MDDRELWLIIRRALIMIVRAIDKRFGLDRPTEGTKEAI